MYRYTPTQTHHTHTHTLTHTHTTHTKQVVTKKDFKFLRNSYPHLQQQIVQNMIKTRGECVHVYVCVHTCLCVCVEDSHSIHIVVFP